MKFYFMGDLSHSHAEGMTDGSDIETKNMIIKYRKDSEAPGNIKKIKR